MGYNFSELGRLIYMTHGKEAVYSDSFNAMEKARSNWESGSI